MITSKLLRLMLLPVLTLLVFALFSKSSAKPDDISLNNPGNGRVIDRETWKYLDNAVKLSIYRAFPHEKKKDFWRLKHEELKKLDWDTAEREHINSLYVIICEHPELMERGAGLQEREDEFEIFLYNWKEHARDVLGWTPKVIYAVSGSGDEVLDTSGELKSSGTAWGTTYEYTTRHLSSDCDLCKNAPDPQIPSLIPYPGNCRAFFICYMGTAIPQLCPEGLRFDVTIQSCNWPEFVYCPNDPD